MELKPKHLSVFCAVIETGSIVAAADKVAMTPSAVSRVIADIEDKIGSSLFNRVKKRLVPNFTGLHFYRKAREGLSLWKELESFSPNNQAEEPIRVAILARHAAPLIPLLVKEFKKSYPDFESCRLHFDVHNHRDFYFSKMSHPFDIGFGCLIGQHSDLDILPLAHIGLYAWGTREIFEGIDTEEITPEEVYDRKPILLPSDTKIGSFCLNALPDIKGSSSTLTVSNTDLALSMAAEGLGIHVTDALAGNEAIGLVRKKLRSSLTIPFSSFTPKDSDKSEIVEGLLNAMKAVIRVKLA